MAKPIAQYNDTLLEEKSRQVAAKALDMIYAELTAGVPNSERLSAINGALEAASNNIGGEAYDSDRDDSYEKDTI